MSTNVHTGLQLLALKHVEALEGKVANFATLLARASVDSPLTGAAQASKGEQVLTHLVRVRPLCSRSRHRPCVVGLAEVVADHAGPHVGGAQRGRGVHPVVCRHPNPARTCGHAAAQALQHVQRRPA